MANNILSYLASSIFTGVAVVSLFLFCSVMPFAMSLSTINKSEMLNLLQDRFPRFGESCAIPPTAILVPGGGVETYIVAVKQGGIPPGPGERITVALELARTYPTAKLVLSGAGEDDPSALFSRSGVDPRRVVRETASHNTFENAALAAQILNPRRDQCFILVTSALHMPRAVGSYRAAGFRISTRSVDYRRMSEPNIERSVRNEFIGLIFYRLTWRIHEVFPR